MNSSRCYRYQSKWCKWENSVVLLEYEATNGFQYHRVRCRSTVRRDTANPWDGFRLS